MPSPEQIRSLFSSIAPSYNRLNAVMTFGLDKSARKAVAKALYNKRATTLLDLATGSGVLAFSVADYFRKKKTPIEITGLDFCQELLEIARADLPNQGLDASIPLSFIQGDALKTGLPQESFDAISIGFGLRNFGSRTQAYAEITRLLRPNGYLYILETTQPKGIRRFFYKLWLPMIPLLAKLSGANPQAYEHLISSTRAFPDSASLSQELTEAGFEVEAVKPLILGSVALHIARKA